MHIEEIREMLKAAADCVVEGIEVADDQNTVTVYLHQPWDHQSWSIMIVGYTHGDGPLSIEALEGDE